MSDTYRPAYVHSEDIEIPQGGDFFISLALICTTDEGSEYLLDTTSYTAFLTVRDENYDGAVVLEANTTNGRIQVGFTPVTWETSTAYGVGEQIVPTALNGFIYECTVAGTSHAATEPTWPTTIGNTVTDGTVTWRCELVENIDNGRVSNCVVQVLAAVTEALDDWGRGVYTLQVINTYGNVIYWQDGEARLRREAIY